MRKEKGLTFFVSLIYAFLFIPLFIIVVTSFGENPTIQFQLKAFLSNGTQTSSKMPLS